MDVAETTVDGSETTVDVMDVMDGSEITVDVMDGSETTVDVAETT